MFPCISTLFTVNLDRDIRTGDRTQGASRALPLLFLEAYRSVSPGIVLPGGDDQTFLACLDAQMAFLAQFLVDDDMSLQMPFLLTWVTNYYGVFWRISVRKSR
jgi:hypothetical protein